MNDRTHNPEVIAAILEIIMQHMADAMRLACVERQRRGCYECVVQLCVDDVDELMNGDLNPTRLNDMELNEYMAEIVKWSRAKALEKLDQNECGGHAGGFDELDDTTFVSGNATCH